MTKSKTFKPENGDQYSDVIEFVSKNLEWVEDQPEGTCWGGGEPSPCDPTYDLKYKYVITIKKYEKEN